MHSFDRGSDVEFTCKPIFECTCGKIFLRESTQRLHRRYKRTLASYIFLRIGVALACFGLILADAKDYDSICSKMSKMKLHQRLFCARYPEVVEALYEGVKQGHRECQHQFRNSSLTFTRWNCSNTVSEDDNETASNLFGVPEPKVGSRESGVFRAFVGAGMLHSLVSLCLLGKIPDCTKAKLYACQGSAKPDTYCQKLDWSVPMWYLNTFFALSKNPITVNDELELHNQAFGYKEVQKRTGLTKTCLGGNVCLQAESLDPLSSSGLGIVSAYKESKKFSKRQTSQLTELAARMEVGSTLLHYRSQYNYCEPSPAWNWAGIGRRPCMTDVHDSYESCNIMCCGFGHVRIPELQRECTMDPTPPYQVKCQVVANVNRYYCKYREESQKTTPFSQWQDPPHLLLH